MQNSFYSNCSKLLVANTMTTCLKMPLNVVVVVVLLQHFVATFCSSIRNYNVLCYLFHPTFLSLPLTLFTCMSVCVCVVWKIFTQISITINCTFILRAAKWAAANKIINSFGPSEKQFAFIENFLVGNNNLSCLISVH